MFGRYGVVGILVASFMLSTACKLGDPPRLAGVDSKLTGLWKMNVAEGAGSNAVITEGILLKDTGVPVEDPVFDTGIIVPASDGIEVTRCLDRSVSTAMLIGRSMKVWFCSIMESLLLIMMLR